ncbi:hypothetical protein L208DRAFT_1382022 [Tricholoma matsutake]|nr:hypothetical protein L208DRAFT_1382022 [Tricholoma matsutake 945]
MGGGNSGEYAGRAWEANITMGKDWKRELNKNGLWGKRERIVPDKLWEAFDISMMSFSGGGLTLSRKLKGTIFRGAIHRCHNMATFTQKGYGAPPHYKLHLCHHSQGRQQLPKPPVTLVGLYNCQASCFEHFLMRALRPRHKIPHHIPSAQAGLYQPVEGRMRMVHNRRR